ncbi:MAG TPA: HlyD family type I secretion periplasmic adaptor subunit [Microvirga sp.]|jgi:HlyD family secretion protein|nr:HlyD family type I secretion periplasmic adaptor subunit [Microvirga sp.]
MTTKATRSEWYAEVPRSTRAPTLYGIAVTAVFLGGFGYWSGTAPIAGAVVASGVFVTTGSNKTVQHLEGGVIKDILVKEGDVVEAGQPVMLLDETAPRAELRRLDLRQARLLAIEARLQAEGRGDERLTLPAPLLTLAATDPAVSEIVAAQSQAFEARLTNLLSEVSTQRAGIDALEERLTGSRTQLQAVGRQLALIEEELETKSNLLKSGMIRRSEVLALQRAQANLQGETGRLMGEIGDTKERIARINEQILGIRNAAKKTAAEQLQEVQAELNDVRERIRSAAGVVDRITIAAPTKGVVVKLRYHSAGGVIEPGKAIMEIVPMREGLVVEARVRPQDIDDVTAGQSAAIRLSALSQRVTPMISGKVVYVSADALPDDKVGPGPRSDVYVVRVALDEGEASSVKHFEPTPGMPAEVYITTAERTFLEYLLQPLKDSMSRAFRES